MRTRQGTRLYSATDLINFLECEHLTTLDLMNLETPLTKTEGDEKSLLIQAKGFQREKAFLQNLQKTGLEIADLTEPHGPEEEKAAQTQRAMEAGADIIYKAALHSGPFIGEADFLRRVDRSTKFGDYGYEVLDTKLASLPKSKFIVQICFYSDLLSEAQGAQPGMMHLVLGDGTERSYRVADFSRYYRFVKERFLHHVNNRSNQTYPESCEQCALCHWRDLCQARWVEDDHLNQVANTTRVQIRKLHGSGVKTLEELARLEEGARVPRMAAETLRKLRRQAWLQAQKRHSGEDRFEILPADSEGLRGFYRLPKPDEGDLFFDMEGDPLESGGLEYLFGVYYFEDGKAQYKDFWAHQRHEERRAFEAFMDFVMERLEKYPGLFIYHYASYEETALKRLMSLHGVRESSVDRLLRSRKLVDLYKVVREGVMVSEPRYSLKNLETFYMEKRAGEVTHAGASIVYYERWKETKDAALLEKIREYNQIDCRSLHLLREWLIKLRPAHISWFVPGDDTSKAEENPAIKEAEERLSTYETDLLADFPQDPAQWTAEQRMRQLVFHLLDFYRREAKPAWWKRFSRQEMTEEELIEDPECLGGLSLDLTQPPFKEKRSMVYTYRFPDQSFKLKRGSPCYRADTLEVLGTIFDIDEDRGLVQIKAGSSRQRPPDRLSLIPEGPMNTEVLKEAIFRFAGRIRENTGTYGAIRSFLSKIPPRFKSRTDGGPIIDENQELLPQAIEAVLQMNEGYLFIQGPPGAGKTHTGSFLIAELLRRGFKVGVSSHSHKAINNLLLAVEKRAQEWGVRFRGFKKSNATETESHLNGQMIRDVFKSEEILLTQPDLIAGTAWLFARPEMDRRLDYLFVDEAGQVSLANLVAVGTSAKNLILLGDQMQLGQPIQGTHPGRSGESSLEYLLGGEATISSNRGIFLGTTHRMHESVCRFISDAIYNGRLHPEPDNEKQRLILKDNAHPELRPAGIRFIPVAHEGCSQKSVEEAHVVKDVFLSLTDQSYIDRKGMEHPIRLENIMVVAPYNMQVNHLRGVLPEGARIGTVDKFQGQEAQVAIISMTTSSGEDLPRNMEFLYSKHRLNVALSRAKCLALLVASPALMAVRCRTVEQMELVNTLCWVREYSGQPD